eukprot:747031-Rhodomonas_salina.1
MDTTSTLTLLSFKTLEKLPSSSSMTVTMTDHSRCWLSPAQALKLVQSLALLVRALCLDQSDLDSIIAQEISSVELIVAEESHTQDPPDLGLPDLHKVINVLSSGTAIAFIAYMISTWIVFMTWINAASDIISTSTSSLSYAFTATTGVVNDTIFHICQSNITAFMHITMTAGWVAMIQE